MVEPITRVGCNTSILVAVGNTATEYAYSGQVWAASVRESVLPGEDPFSETRVKKRARLGAEEWDKKPSVMESCFL